MGIISGERRHYGRLMSYLHRHPKTGVYWFRRVVPEHLRPAIGKREIKKTLGTKDRGEANLRCYEVAREVEAWFQSQDGSPRSLSKDERLVLARDWHAGRVKELTEEAETATDLEPLVEGYETGRDILIDELEEFDRGHPKAAIPPAIVDQRNKLLRDRGLNLTDESRKQLDQDLMRAMVLVYGEAIKALRDRASYKGWAREFREAEAPIRLGDLTEDYIRHSPDLREYTAKNYRSKVDRFKAFVGHDDLRKITRNNIIEWRDSMRDAGLNPKTIKNYLEVISAVCGWAVEEGRLTENPAKGVRVRVGAFRQRRLPYTDEEAAKLLQAARSNSGAQRWVPWLLAYTGARLEEVCQAFAKDIRRAHGIWVFDIHDHGEGMAVKTEGSVRLVPLHPALVDEGFLAYVEQLPNDSRLFPELTQGGHKKWSAAISKWYGRWSRKVLGEVDRRKVAHSWRHKFKDMCRDAGVHKENHDKLTGHGPADTGGDYGTGAGLRRLHEEVCKLPKLL